MDQQFYNGFIMGVLAVCLVISLVMMLKIVITKSKIRLYRSERVKAKIRNKEQGLLTMQHMDIMSTIDEPYIYEKYENGDLVDAYLNYEYNHRGKLIGVDLSITNMEAKTAESAVKHGES